MQLLNLLLATIAGTATLFKFACAEPIPAAAGLNVIALLQSRGVQVDAGQAVEHDKCCFPGCRTCGPTCGGISHCTLPYRSCCATILTKDADGTEQVFNMQGESVTVIDAETFESLAPTEDVPVAARDEPASLLARADSTAVEERAPLAQLCCTSDCKFCHGGCGGCGGPAYNTCCTLPGIIFKE